MKMKKVSAILLAVAMVATPTVSPMNVLPTFAAEARANAAYTHKALVTVNNGTGVLVADAADVAKFAGATSFTFNTTFTCTGSGVNSLFFIGDSSATSNYVSVYLSGQTLGIEALNGSKVYETTKNLDAGVNLREEHKLTVVMEGKSKIKFYLDGEKIHEAAVTADFVNGIIANPNYLGFGKGNRANNGNNYPFTGTQKDIELYASALTEEEILDYHAEKEREDLVYKAGNKYFGANASYEAVTGEAVEELKALNQGTITVRYRAAAANNGLMSLFSLSDSTQSSKYLSLYINPSANTIGVEILGGTGANGNNPLNDSHLGSVNRSIQDTKWHTLTLTKASGGGAYRFWLDGVYINQYSRNKFMDGIDTANTIGIGYTDRAAGQNEYNFKGAIDSVQVLSTVLSDAEIKAEHNKLAFESRTVEDLEGVYKTEDEKLFYGGYDGSVGYRIPSLLTTSEGTIIAGIDKRQSGMGDQGNIDIAVRRKEAGADSFGDPTIVLDMNNTPGEGRVSFLIDSCMVENKSNGRIYMAVDMFPESTGLMGNPAAEIHTGSGYERIGENDYQMLYTDGRDDSTKFGTIREDGIVYDNAGNPTDYRVVTKCQAPYQEFGNLYKNGEFKGNIYRYTGADKGELSVMRTQYLWLTYSEDDGKTWSVPKDITPQVKTNDMIFLGTGPGVGIQLKNGKLAIPVYSATGNVGGTQSSAIIISDDGEHWTLKESPNPNHNIDASKPILTESQLIQAPNEDLYLFMRNGGAGSGRVKVSVSSDEGTTWSEPQRIENIPEVYCQLTVTTYMKGNEMYVILANPSGEKVINGSARAVGKVYVGKFNSETGNIDWLYDKYINHQRYGYSCISVIDADEANDGANPKFGLFYEDETNAVDMLYTEFDEAWIKNTATKTTTQEAPKLVDKEVTVDGSTMKIKLTFDQVVMAAGEAKLNLTVGNQTFDAAYTGGSATDTLTFTAEITDTMLGVVKVTGMSESAGYLENTKNDKPVFNNEVLFDLTKIRTGLSIHDYSSQHSASTAENTDGAAVNAIDGNPKTYWHSKWGSTDTLPQWITVNLGEVKNIYKLSYIPRQNQSSGRVTKYEILGSTNGVDFDKITSGTFTTGTNEQYTEFAPTEVQYIRFKVNESTVAGSCNVAELGFYEYQEGVIEAGNKAQLQTLVASLAELDEADYSDASWTRLMAEKAKAEAALAEEVISQSRLDAAYNSLLLAKRQLVDITFADAMKAAYAALNETDYTTESWEAFETAMAEINIDELLNAADTNREATHVIMKVNYEMSKLVEQEVKKTYAVKVKQVDGTLVEQGTYDYNDKVVITEADVPNAPEGKKFVGWEVDGKIVSTVPEYTFYASGNVTLIPVYDTKPVEKKAEALITNVIVTEGAAKSDVKFVGQLIIPEGYKIVKAGLIWSTKKTPFIVDGALNTALKPTYITRISNTNQFSVTIKGMPNDKYIRGSIFAIVQKEGEPEKLIYSGEQKAVTSKTQE